VQGSVLSSESGIHHFTFIMRGEVMGIGASGEKDAKMKDKDRYTPAR